MTTKSIKRLSRKIEKFKKDNLNKEVIIIENTNEKDENYIMKITKILRESLVIECKFIEENGDNRIGHQYILNIAKGRKPKILNYKDGNLLEKIEKVQKEKFNSIDKLTIDFI